MGAAVPVRIWQLMRKDRMQQEKGRIEGIREHICFQAVWFLVLSVMEYITLEAFLGGDIATIGFVYGAKNVSILLGVNLILVSLFHRLRPALLISEAAVFVLGAANYFVDSFRGYGIVYMDFFAVKTAANVAGDYSYAPDVRFFLGAVSGLSGIVLCFLAPGKKKKIWNLRSAAGSILGIALGAGFFLWINFGYGFWSDVSNLTWDHSIGISKYGYLLYVMANAGEAGVEMPEGYSVERVDGILSRYRDADKRNSVLASHAGDARSPNLIMIMNESFSDLGVLGQIETDRPYLDFYDSLEKNTIKGYANSSVYGGYTANSEFEFLTGCSKAFLPGNPYLQYLDDYIPSLISNIKEQDRYERGTAMHPYRPSGYNRNRVYPLLHFDEFLNINDCSKKGTVRKYISDASDYEWIEELYEKKKAGTSLCLFNVTMQNHSPYDDASYTFREPVKITNHALQFDAEQFLSLMKLSDDALRGLVGYFQKVEEPTLIVLFGDHQPHLSDYFYHKVMGKVPDELSGEQAMRRYQVPFLIWANYDIREAQIDCISINYLSTLMMETAGLELTDFQRFLLDMYQYIPSVSANGYYDAHGRLHEWKDRDSESGRWLEEYEMIQYNYLFDKENRLDEHFKISERP